MNPPTSEGRRGVLAAGTFVLDQVKTIDAWPDQDMLANITSEFTSNGGGPYNVLKDLHALGAPFPLEAAGLLGDDANAEWIRRDCSTHGIDVTQLRGTTMLPTSYTDAMCVAGENRRTFFHRRGANSLLSANHIDLHNSDSRIFLLGYLLLLDTLDRVEADGSTGASRILEKARALGFLTAVETASARSEQFRKVAVASLQHADLFFLNEIEASLLLGRTVDPSEKSMRSAVGDLAALGSPGRVVMHSAQGAVCGGADGAVFTQPALELPAHWINGNTGAGDAFTAAVILGIHEGADMSTCLMQGVCSAAQSLTHPTASDGLAIMDECMALSERFAFRDF